ncbi:MAG: FtsX-like permease family protein [Anaerolineaceae bacterium]
MRPRWNKVFADLWSNKVRSLLVIASIAIGLFATGMLSSISAWLDEGMRPGYAAINPANIIITSTGFDQDYVDHIRNFPGVENAEGVNSMNLRLQTSPDTTIPIDIKAIPDMPNTINQLTLVEGVYPPNDREIVLDKNKLADTGAKVGDFITVRLASGKLRSLKVVGVVHDLTIGSSGVGGGFFIAPVQGYITYDTLTWLEQPEKLNTLYVTVSDGKEDLDHIHQINNQILTEFDRDGLTSLSTSENRSTDHPNNPYLDSLVKVMYILGLLIVFLSGFLITNTLSALLNQQIQQVGVMKTFGASQFQVIGVYAVLILIYSLIALGLSILFSDRVAYLELQFLAERINFIAPEMHPVARSIILQTVIALVVPQIAGAIPILQGTRITIQQALSGVTTESSTKQSPIYNVLTKVRGLSRPMLISLRNTFRRRLRLILTLITLILGGAIFIATFNVSDSMNHYVDQVGKYFIADVNLSFSQPYSIDEMNQILLQTPGVVSIEGWAIARAETIQASGIVGESVTLQAPPADSHLIDPLLLSGRWIQPGDQNAIVLSEMFSENDPNLKIGDTLRLKVNGKETDWIVVGFFQFAGKSGGLFAYTNYDYLSKLTGTPGKSTSFRVVANDNMHTLEKQEELGRQLEINLNRLGYQVIDVLAGLSLRDSTSSGLNTLTTFLLLMALLMAAVGSIGLMGTMSLNVMERTREIGIMRAIGATDRDITRMVMVESLLIGMISWALSCLVSFPIGKLLCNVIGIAIFSNPIEFVFTPTGIIIWFVLVLILSILASALPARNAAHLTIREVLAYE